MSDDPYQLFAPLQPEVYAALRQDIAARGVLVPVEYDEAGAILDGHHRAAIARELGIEFPTVVRHFASETERHEHVIKLNLARRHLDAASWGKAFAQLLALRGVTASRGARNDRTSATVADVAREVGTAERTARHRLFRAKQYEALDPARRALVDTGESLSRQAALQRREAARRRGRAQAEAEQRPSTVAVMPLERLWATQRGRARTAYERRTRQFAALEQAALDCGIPPDGDLVSSLRAAATTVLAADWEALAALDDETPLPPEHGTTLWVTANAHQKNQGGWCARVGCWNLVVAHALCGQHRATAPPEEAAQPRYVVYGVAGRPGWTTWGLEALEGVEEILATSQGEPMLT